MTKKVAVSVGNVSVVVLWQFIENSRSGTLWYHQNSDLGSPQPGSTPNTSRIQEFI